MPRPGDLLGKALRVLIGCLIVATCVRVWVGPSAETPRAYGQIPDAGAQRLKLLDETHRTNELLEQMIKILQTHTFKVEIDGTDKTKCVERVHRVNPD